MLPRRDVAWFDIPKHPGGLVLHSSSDGGLVLRSLGEGGDCRRVILTKAFGGPYMAALILGLSPEKKPGFRPTSNGRIVDHSKVQTSK